MAPNAAASWVMPGAVPKYRDCARGRENTVSGDPGDPVIGFRHVRQPAEEVGPWQLLHDQERGEISVHHEVDPVALARSAGPAGLTLDDFITAQNPDKQLNGRARSAAREKARRTLDRLVEAGKLTRLDGSKGGARGGTPTTWFAS
jgi:hypothetical protein